MALDDTTIGAELMEGGEACQLMVCNGQWFQFLISKENMSMYKCVCVCVFVELRGGVRRAVNTHLVAWSEPRTQANQSWVTGSFQKHNNRDWNTGVGPHWGVETQTLTRAFVHSLPPEVCPRLGVPTRTPSPPPRPQACWGCTCWKCRSWACVFAVSERWTSRYIKNWRTLKSWKTI